MNDPTDVQAILDSEGAVVTLGDARIDSPQRAVLLYLLADQLRRDRALGLSESQAGWLPDGALRTGIWGRPGRTQLPNNINVLICRTRRQLAQKGVDPNVIEKVPGYTRLRARQVQVS